MTDLMELASRVAEAKGPDRALDAEIAVTLDVAVDGNRYTASYLHSVGNSFADIGQYTDCPAYTASLDAAMTLVNGVGVLMGLSDIGADGLPMARVGCPQFDGAPIFTGIASCIMTKTAPVAGLAMALTAAALKARAAQESSHG